MRQRRLHQVEVGADVQPKCVVPLLVADLCQALMRSPPVHFRTTPHPNSTRAARLPVHCGHSSHTPSFATRGDLLSPSQARACRPINSRAQSEHQRAPAGSPHRECGAWCHCLPNSSHQMAIDTRGPKGHDTMSTTSGSKSSDLPGRPRHPGVTGIGTRSNGSTGVSGACCWLRY